MNSSLLPDGVVTKEKVALSFFGKTFTIYCKASERESLDKAITVLQGYVDDYMQNHKTLSLDDVLVMLSLNLISELENEKIQPQEDEAYKNALGKMHHKIDRVLRNMPEQPNLFENSAK